VIARAAAIRFGRGASPLVFFSGLPGVTSHHTIKLQPLERKQGRPEMRLVRRIECPPKKTNSHAGRVQGQQALRNSGFFGCHGRV
jgi:hypothetical protein